MIASVNTPPPQYSYVLDVTEKDRYVPINQLSSALGPEDEKLFEGFIRYQRINDSFLSHEGRYVSENVQKTFDSIAQEFRTVPFSRVNAEYSKVMEMIQFSFDFTNGLRVSFGKSVNDESSSDVYFSLVADSDVLLVDKNSIEDLKNVLLETIKV